MKKGVAILFVFISTLYFYSYAVFNIYELVMIVIKGNFVDKFEFGFWGTFGFPILVLIVGSVLNFHKNSPVLFPFYILSVGMFWGMQISLAIVHLGFGQGSTIVQQAVFLILGLIGFIATRWGVCHYIYKHHEAGTY
ncbi:MAG TPA: hypothetical protein VJ546_03495 [Bacillales bacterium]|nr:hypothetical protein [Bacillales bacterium]